MGIEVRLNPGNNPNETALAEYVELPLNEKGEPVEGFSPRGMDVDRNDVAWVALASGHPPASIPKNAKYGTDQQPRDNIAGRAGPFTPSHFRNSKV